MNAMARKNLDLIRAHVWNTSAYHGHVLYLECKSNHHHSKQVGFVQSETETPRSVRLHPVESEVHISRIRRPPMGKSEKKHQRNMREGGRGGEREREGGRDGRMMERSMG